MALYFNFSIGLLRIGCLNHFFEGLQKGVQEADEAISQLFHENGFLSK